MNGLHVIPTCEFKLINNRTTKSLFKLLFAINMCQTWHLGDLQKKYLGALNIINDFFLIKKKHSCY